MRIKLAILILLFVSCAQVTSLNLRKHRFGKIPTKIIWLQVPGLTAEHMALLKFAYPSRERKTAFEQALCIGTIWDYDLYKIRPKASNATLSQLTGKKNIKGECSDYKNKPIWSYVTKKNYKAAVFESQTRKDQSLLKSLRCEEGKDYLEDIVYFGMNESISGGKYFHVDDKRKYEVGEKYFDKSCKKNECYTTFSRNVQGSFEQFSKNIKNYVYVVRNFRYHNLLKQNAIKQARLELEEVNNVLSYFNKLASKSNDVLVLLSGAESLNVDFPRAGREWRSYVKKARYLRVINSKLLSPVFASGARAENFCGVYDQSQLLSRIFSGSKQQGLEFSIINPFE